MLGSFPHELAVVYSFSETQLIHLCADKSVIDFGKNRLF
jgi:hypothetical protein